MNETQTLLAAEREDLLKRLGRFIETVARHDFRALVREMRAFETRVRMWLIALALARPAANAKRAAAGRKPSINAPPLPAFLNDAGRLPSTRTGERAAKDRQAPMPDDLLQLIGVMKWLDRLAALRVLIDNPEPVLAVLARKLLRGGPVSTKAAPRPTRPTTLHPHTDELVQGETQSRVTLPPPDT